MPTTLQGNSRKRGCSDKQCQQRYGYRDNNPKTSTCLYATSYTWSHPGKNNIAWPSPKLTKQSRSHSKCLRLADLPTSNPGKQSSNDDSLNTIDETERQAPIVVAWRTAPQPVWLHTFNIKLRKVMLTHLLGKPGQPAHSLR